MIEGFVVDYYCKELKLAIEVDGSFHDNRKEYDRLRQDIIESEGINVIRISNKEVEDGISILLNKLEGFIANN